MQLTQFTVRLIVLFLPGLIGAVFFQLFSTKGQVDNRSFITKIILISFLSYAIVYVLSLCSPIIIKCTFFDALSNEKVPINYSELLLPILFSIVIAIIYLYISNYHILFKIGNIFRITTNTGENDVWGELFNNSNNGINDFAYVRLLNEDKMYSGFVKHYSMNSDKKYRELLLENVFIYKNSKTKVSLGQADKVFLQLKNDDNIIIEISRNEENANNGQQGQKTHSRQKKY